MKKSLMIVSFLLLAWSIYSDVLVDATDLAMPVSSAKPPNLGKLATPVLITSDMNWRGVVQPGRNVIAKGDTISVVYSVTTTDPTFTQQMYQSYSVDGGLIWTANQIGHNWCVRTYPHSDQINNITSSDPLGVSPYIIWQEKLASTVNDTLFFAYDDYPVFALFNPVPVNVGLSSYFSYICVWGDGDTLFATALDWITKDIRGWTSEDYGQNWTQVPFRTIGSDAGAVQALVDNGSDGYGFAYYGLQYVSGRPIYPKFKETTDYGQTWTSEQEFLNIAVTDSLGNDDTLSVTWQGFSLIVDPNTNIPYIAGKFDPHKDPDYSYNYGEIWFTKPSTGIPGAYTFDANNPIPVFTGDPNVFEHLAGYATISYYYSYPDSGIVLMIFFDALAQDSLSWQLYCASSIDEGNTWDVQQVTPNDTAMENDMVDASYYVSQNGDVSIVFCNSSGTHNETDHLEYYYLPVNVVMDLGLPPVSVEENTVVVIPSVYRVNASTTRGQCSFAVGLPEGGMTSLKVYDATGRMVTELVNRYLSAGQYNFSWNTSGIPSGNYIYRLKSNGFVTTGKVIVAE
ncbi:T9SS type A sorting domain-containing protein [candidate division WOR-3 bacterium]|nr:T9SS type A sorting domain-containing protein [candidate division WOR-3 bacterium]